MNKIKYYFLAAVVSLSLSACNDDDNSYNMLDGIGMVNRSVSVTDGVTVHAGQLDKITLDYNNLVGIDAEKAVTLNGQALTPVVNPENRMQVIIPVSLKPYTDYTLVIPEGAFYRSDNPKVMAEGMTITFNTNAGANPANLAKSLTNPNATPEARKVYQFLLDNYGVKQLSGAMGEVAWGTAFCDLIKEKSGKFPAIVGFDYIHLASSPSNWIDYGDITPVQKVWNAGSIPAVTWHWNVPMEVWTGESQIGDWGNLRLDKEEMPGAMTFWENTQDGTYLVVKFKDAAADAQGAVKGSDWDAVMPSTGYFDLTDDQKAAGEYRVRLNGEAAAKIREGGVIISGQNYTVTGVYFELTCRDTKDVKGFDASKVLTPGTRENTVATADVAKLAGYLKLLQDANIPVLFRPFHEAAGAYQWTWFWWGNSGVDVTKDLWKWLHDTLTNDYGLNNLIWVWTANYNYGMDLADVETLQSEYPGDAYVDIVGTDIYKEAMSDQSAVFNLIQEATNGSKIIALTETGNLLDPDSQFNNNALWSFFMGWYEQDANGPGFLTWNLNGEWNTVLNNPLVLNQGDFSF
ncbi:MAG: glycoside hydrolase family 26 protein [Duncaniella sp.]|uniref:glycosyl hydrolase n=1 Tax=Duncaniella sp. TaxID=2518496 RepID=UPI0023CDE744|nr:glycosyl hydrolase [Duncaniella sp.]MDE5989361.1 glycoside hydrolase family 26 protein [Duncaniella sp.]